MLRKMLAALSVAMVAFLFTSPTALATDEDNTNNVTYWQTYFGDGTVCYKDDSSKGTVSGKTVTLKDNGWDYLIVKGGSVDTGDGPGNKIYSNPTKNTPYAAPDNAGGQPSDVSHWIVCGTPEPPEDPYCLIDGEKFYEDSDLPTGYTWKDGGDCTPPQEDPYCLIDDVKYYSAEGLPEGYVWNDSGEGCTPPQEDPYCLIDDVKYYEDSDLPEGYTWKDGGDCTTPPPYCLIDDVKYYEEDVLPAGYTWTDEGLCTPPVDVCENLRGDQAEVPEGYFYDEETGDCFKKVYVCKYVTTPGDFEVLQTGNNPIAVSVNALPDGFTGTFPWAFSDAQGKSIAFAWAVPGTPQDQEPGLEDCPQPPPVKVCEYINGVAVAVEYAPDALPEGYILWVNGSECTPTDVCVNLSGYQGETPDGWTNEDGYCFYEETVCWLMDNYDGGDDYPPAGAYSTFPQTRVDCEIEIPCGMWIQKDVYHMDSWTDDSLYKSLGDVLEWVNGEPEDTAIYKSHVFLYGGDCPPPPPYCLIDDVKYYEEDVLPDGYTWTDEGLCTPPVDVCENLRGDQAEVPEGYFYDEETGDCFKKVYVCKYVTTPGGGEILQTGNNPISVSVNALKDFPGTLPWSFNDAQGRSIAFAWAVPGTPQDEEPGLEDCPLPPHEEGFDVTVEQECVVPADGTATKTTFHTHWVRNAVWNAESGSWELGPTVYSAPEVFSTEIVEDSECQPPVDVCPNIEGPQSEVPEGLLLYGEGSSTKCATPPSLAGTLFASQCIDDVPWIVYDVNLTDPDDVSTDDGTATFTFTAPGYPGETYVKTVDIGSGKFLWPGATATDNGDGTWTATGWPGWALIDGEWVSIGDDNYGWTRDGVSVTIEVNPEMTVSLTYPPPTALCVAGPPTEVDDELDAPPATPVEAEAQFAG